MPQFIQRIDNLGRREATTVPTATTQRVFASINTAAPNERQAVNLTNLDAAADLYVSMVRAGSTAPTISATDCDLVITAKSDRQFQIGSQIEIYIRSSAAGAVSYTALELL